MCSRLRGQVAHARTPLLKFKIEREILVVDSSSRVPFSDKDLSEIRNVTSGVNTFQIAKSKHKQDVRDWLYTKTIHCLIITFRATNAVLEPDRAQPS